MKLSRKLLPIFALLLAAPLAHSDPPSASTLGHFIKQMYSYSIDLFEYGEFEGRRDDKKSCVIARQYFDGPILNSFDTPVCRYKRSRFAPDFDGTPMEEVLTADGMNLPPPIPFIQSIKVSGDQAQIDILFGAADAPKGVLPNTRLNQGRVIFFLKNLPQGWRIVNKLSFKKWPLDLSGERSNCMMASSDFQFAVAPRAASDLTWLPPACQKVMLHDLIK